MTGAPLSKLVSFEIVIGVELNNGSRLCYLVFGMAGNNQARAGSRIEPIHNVA